ncbi:MAG: LysR family transcriptional regulator [Bacteriovoracaceae bacterium]|nr:LysR family transcriptional regulator [Bacteriovoracaceae bacterium]
METNRLKQFCTLCETGNLRKAADLLSISHSGLSKSMKLLELEVGKKLFHPSGRGIVITDFGINFAKKSQKLMKELDLLLEDDESHAPTAILRIGSFEVFTTYFMGPLLKEYLPNLEVEIHELVPGRLEESLLFHKVDVGITYEPIPRSGIEYVKIAALQMGAFALPHIFSELKLEDVPFIVPVTPLEGAPSGIKGRDAWPDEKLKRNIKFRVDLLGTALEIARQGLGAVFIPRFLARLHNLTVKSNFRLELLDAPKSVSHVKRDVYLVKRESSSEDKSLRQLAKALREILSNN